MKEVYPLSLTDGRKRMLDAGWIFPAATLTQRTGFPTCVLFRHHVTDKPTHRRTDSGPMLYAVRHGRGQRSKMNTFVS